MLVYVRDGGVFSNDLFAIVSKVDGKLRHFRSTQFRFLTTIPLILKMKAISKKAKTLKRTKHASLAFYKQFSNNKY